MKIIISEFMDDAAVETLRAQHNVVYDPQLVDQPNALMEHVRDAQALIVRNRTQVRGALLDAATELKVVGRLGVGLDNIDVSDCERRGVTVIPATGANSRAVAEYVIGTAMLLLRRSYLSTAQVAAGAWPRGALSSGREIGGKTLGLIGFGGIGRLTAQLAQGLGMRVVAHDPALKDDDPVWESSNVQPRTLDALLTEADVVSLHVPLVEGTRNLINAERLSLMKADAVLINSARGGIVDEAAVAYALREGRLGGAALDVFADEPLPATSTFNDIPNLVLTPHIAGVTAESNTRVSELIAQRVAEALQGHVAA
jgi:Phosphoglycerate dehydrogenase and related dehydrogenases